MDIFNQLVVKNTPTPQLQPPPSHEVAVQQWQRGMESTGNVESIVHLRY